MTLFETCEGGGVGNGTLYAVCSTASNVQNKTVTIEDLEELKPGMTFNVKFINANTFGTYDSSYVVGTPPTLQINELPVKPIKCGGRNVGVGFVAAGDIHTFVYDGTAFNDVTSDVVFKDANAIMYRSGAYNTWNGSNLDINF